MKKLGQRLTIASVAMLLSTTTAYAFQKCDYNRNSFSPRNIGDAARQIAGEFASRKYSNPEVRWNSWVAGVLSGRDTKIEETLECSNDGGATVYKRYAVFYNAGNGRVFTIDNFWDNSDGKIENVDGALQLLAAAMRTQTSVAVTFISNNNQANVGTTTVGTSTATNARPHPASSKTEEQLVEGIVSTLSEKMRSAVSIEQTPEGVRYPKCLGIRLSLLREYGINVNGGSIHMTSDTLKVTPVTYNDASWAATVGGVTFYYTGSQEEALTKLRLKFAYWADYKTALVCNAWKPVGFVVDNTPHPSICDNPANKWAKLCGGTGDPKPPGPSCGADTIGSKSIAKQRAINLVKGTIFSSDPKQCNAQRSAISSQANKGFTMESSTGAKKVFMTTNLGAGTFCGFGNMAALDDAVRGAEGFRATINAELQKIDCGNTPPPPPPPPPPLVCTPADNHQFWVQVGKHCENEQYNSNQAAQQDSDVRFYCRLTLPHRFTSVELAKIGRWFEVTRLNLPSVQREICGILDRDLSLARRDYRACLNRVGNNPLLNPKKCKF